MEIKWIKIATGMFDDEAIQIMLSMPEGSTLLEIWLRLLIAAGKTNDNGLIYVKKQIPYTEDMLAMVFRKDVSMIKYALSTFKNFGMIEVLTNNQILITNWEKHQNIDGMERIKELTKNRVRKHREKQKALLLENKNGCCNVTCNVSETVSNALDIEEEIDIEKEIKEVEKQQLKQSNRFKKPTIEEIKAYCEERKNDINAEYFYDYYESKGWKIGKNSMKDWHAAVRTWERKEFSGGAKNEPSDKRNSTKFDRQNGWF